MKYIHRLFIQLLIICISVFLPVEKLFSQVYSTMDSEEIIEQLSGDEEEERQSVENMLEKLSELRVHPIDINTITKEQLEQFPFLSDIQIENILFYLYVTGGMRTIYELQLVEEMDRQTIQYLLPFVYLGEPVKQVSTPSLKDMLKYGKNELLIRFNIALHPGKEEKSYLGSSLYHSLRYGFHYKNRLYFGVIAEKDSGEPFFVKKNRKGYDFYSFYFLLKDIGNLKALALGNYRLSFGMGLVMNMDFGMGKSSSVASVGYRNGGIRKHSSTDEYNYLHGAAATYRLNKLMITGFYSYKRPDATVENKLITSFKKDGLHRNDLDFNKRNKAVMQTFGSNLVYIASHYQLGLTGVYNCFNKLFVPDFKPYNIYYPRGKSFYAFSADYRFRWNKLSFSGETAVCGSGGMAALHVLRLSPLSGYQLIFSHRYYSRNYYSWFARSLSEGADIRNESGYYIGIEADPIKYWKFFLYADCFYFPWLRYGIDKPSYGFDGLVQATYSPKRILTMFWRYQYKIKDKNCSAPVGEVCTFVRHKLRYQLGYALPKSLSFRTTLDFISIGWQGGVPSCGFMLSQQLSYSFQQFPLQLSVHYAFFDTDDYESRLTTYEKGMLYTFSFLSFYGKGIRSSVYLRYDFNKYLTGIVKISQSKYKETSTAVARNNRANIDCQLSCKF